MMIEKVASDFYLFDSLVSQDLSFSIYRLPGDNTMTFVMQREGAPEYLHKISELNGKEGFVIAPFDLSAKTPIVLLHPDIVLEGEKNILTFCKELTASVVLSQSVIVSNDENTDPYINYKRAFELFQSALRSSNCEKIVLSRTLNRPKPNDFSAGKTFKVACEAYPEAFVYLCHTPETGTWLGSSPELMLSGEKTSWNTVALAGTMKLSAKNKTEDWDEKNIREQNIVAEYLGTQLRSHHLTYVKNGPITSKAGRLMHLKTEFSFQMDKSVEIGDLLESLHPTPAVCGLPKEAVYRLIIEKEGYDRKYYSGFIGPLSMKGKTDLFVNLRCMQINTNSLTLFAGGGLLSSSDLDSEWEETEEKLQTMLSLIDF